MTKKDLLMKLLNVPMDSEVIFMRVEDFRNPESQSYDMTLQAVIPETVLATLGGERGKLNASLVVFE